MLALTMGDPAGIGGELTAQAWGANAPMFVALDDPARLRRLGNVPIIEVASVAEAKAAWPHGLPVLPVPLAAEPHPGRPDARNSPAVILSIRRATELAQSGDVDGIVTNPIAKSVLYQSGFAFPGHTEFIAHLTATPHPVMMLASPLLRVVPVTIHVSLRQALAQLRPETIVRTATILTAALKQDFGLANPRLAIAGVNPHAGENGSMGDEEITIVAPAIATLRAAGLDVSGPWSPDALFTESARACYDAAIGMYHDQVLIPLKALDRDHGVNVTLGLPIVRTSPDHGTAFAIAGTGRANPSSLRAALAMAHAIAARRAATR